MKTKLLFNCLLASAFTLALTAGDAKAQNSALATSGMGGGASSTARLTAQVAQQQDRADAIELCGNKAKIYAPSFGGAKDADNCATGIDLTTAGNVGIGTSPTRKLDVNGDAKINTLRLGVVGHGTGWPGISNNALGDSGGQYAIIQNASGQTLVNSAAGQSLNFRIGNADQMVLLSNGNFGVGIAAPTSKLHVNGTANITSTLNVSGAATMGSNLTVTNNVTANAFFYNSDRELKTNIRPIENGADIISNLEPVYFDWKKDNTHSIGFIAQDVQKQVPEAVTETPDGTLAVDYAKLVAPLMAAVKEQQAEIAALKEQIEDLSERLEHAE